MLDPFVSINIAVILLILGKILTMRIEVLRVYAIPEPVLGGFVCAAVVAAVYAATGTEIAFSLDLRDFLLLLFFAGIGLKADVATLIRGGRPLLLLTALASVFIVLQNLVGMGMAGLFGVEPLLGLMLGSISLTGGVGTTLAWAPIFSERLGIEGALEFGVAANTVGLISACVIGGPIAAWLIRRHKIPPPMAGDVDIGVAHDEPAPKLDYFALLWAFLILNVTVMAGLFLHEFIAMTPLTLPAFVSCLMAGIVLRNVIVFTIGARLRRTWPGINDALALVSDLSLGLFLTMTLMGLQLWQLGGVFTFIASTMAVQILLAVVFSGWIVFRMMGADYEASVISAGFGGIALGSTATAIANMTAVAQQHGPAHRAFIIVPLVCGFFIDIVNALIISYFVG